MRTLILLLSSSIAAFAQGYVPVPFTKVGGSGNISYTGQTCTGYNTSTFGSVTCGSSITVSVNDIVVLFSNMNALTTLSSVTFTGTATITGGSSGWTCPSGASAQDSTNTGTIVGCWAQVNGAGTMTPTANWTADGPLANIVVAAFSGAQAATDGTGSAHDNSAAGSGANAQLSGTFTTSVSNDALISAIISFGNGDNNSTMSAGTNSISMTKIGTCVTGTTFWPTCIAWGKPAPVGSTTQADWTIGTTQNSLVSVIAIKTQ